MPIPNFPRWIIRALYLLLGVVIVYLAWDAIQQLQRPPLGPSSPGGHAAAEAGPAAPGTRVSDRSRYRDIVQRHLFGAAPTAPDNALGIDIEALEKTKLDLKLWGTVYDEEGANYAVIETQRDKKQSLYRVGEYIENARIRLILRHRIVLSVDGRDEVLELHESLQTAGAPSGWPSGPRQGPDPSQLVTVDPDLLFNFLDQPETVARHAQVTAAAQEDGGQGVVLEKLERGSIFQKLGLVQGDVIEASDGVPLSAPEDIAGLLEELAFSGEKTISVKRRGKSFTIRFALRDPDLFPQDN